MEQRQPEAIWRSERQIRSEQPFVANQEYQEHRPDAEVLIGIQKVAIEAERKIKAALRLPTLYVAGQTLLKRLTWVARDGAIERVFYPVFPPDRNATEVLDWLRQAEAPISPPRPSPP